MIYTPIIWPILLAAAINLSVAFICHRHREVPAARTMELLLLCAAFWAADYAIELSTANLPVKVALMQIRFLVLPFISVLELILVLQVVNRNSWIAGWRKAPLLLIPLATTILALTLQYQPLFRTGIHVDSSGPFPVLLYTNEIGYLVYIVYTDIVLVTALGLLVFAPCGNAFSRRQRLIVLAGLSIPFLSEILFQAGITPVNGFTMTPVMLTISGLVLAYAIFRYQFLDIVPAARRIVIDSLNSPMVVIDSGSRILDLNLAAARLLGFPPAAAIGKPAREIMAGKRDLWDRILDPSSGNREITIGAAPEDRTYSISIEPIDEGGGSVIGTCILLHDITERKKAEEEILAKNQELALLNTELLLSAEERQRYITEIQSTSQRLHESEKFYRSIIDNIQDAYIRSDIHGNIVMVSPSAARTYRYRSVDEMIGIPATSLYSSPQLRDRVIHLLWEKGGTQDFVGEALRKDGTTFWASLNARIYRDDDGNALGIEAFVRDITERKKAEEALRESEATYRAIIEDMQDLYYRTDRDGRITMISPSGVRLVGFSTAEEVIGRRADEMYVNPKDRERLLAVMEEKGAVDAYPLVLRIGDGQIRYATTSSHLIRNANGEITGMEGIIHDVTDLKQAEDALRTANKKLNLLSSITRHDILNQLAALDGALHILTDESIGREKREKFLAIAQRSAQNIERQIRFTRNYQDLGVKSPSWQNLGGVVENAREALDTHILNPGSDIASLEVYADPLFGKVFYNLIDNSLRYGGDGMTSIRVTSHPSGDSMMIVYEDDGAGISAEEKKHLFTPGFGKNTGLGLFLTREILAITGITIEEDGLPGRGARFVMTVPNGAFRFRKGTP